MKGSQREKGFSVGERGHIMNEEVETYRQRSLFNNGLARRVKINNNVLFLKFPRKKGKTCQHNVKTKMAIFVKLFG